MLAMALIILLQQLEHLAERKERQGWSFRLGIK
jgi:hypothetical protein